MLPIFMHRIIGCFADHDHAVSPKALKKVLANIAPEYDIAKAYWLPNRKNQKTGRYNVPGVYLEVGNFSYEQHDEFYGKLCRSLGTNYLMVTSRDNERYREKILSNGMEEVYSK